MIRVIHIDPVAQTVSTVEIENSVEGLQKAVNGYFAVATRLPNGDALLVDEEGSFKEHTRGFYFGGGRPVLVGPAIVIGVRGADFVAAKTSIEEIQGLVEFTPVSRRS